MKVKEEQYVYLVLIMAAEKSIYLIHPNDLSSQSRHEKYKLDFGFLIIQFAKIKC